MTEEKGSDIYVYSVLRRAGVGGGWMGGLVFIPFADVPEEIDHTRALFAADVWPVFVT